MLKKIKIQTRNKNKDYTAVLLEEVRSNFKIFGEELTHVRKKGDMATLRVDMKEVKKDVAMLKGDTAVLKKDMVEVKEELHIIRNELK